MLKIQIEISNDNLTPALKQLAHGVLAALDAGDINTALAKPCLPAVDRPPAIGEFWREQGGFYAGYVCSDFSEKSWHLILADIEKTNVCWAEGVKQEIDFLTLSDGSYNTGLLLQLSEEAYLETTFHAAKWASGISDGFHHDYYLPAIRELEQLFSAMPSHFSDAIYLSSTSHDNGCEVYGAEFIKDCTLKNFPGSRVLVEVDRHCRALAVRRVVFNRGAL